MYFPLLIALLAGDSPMKVRLKREVELVEVEYLEDRTAAIVALVDWTDRQNNLQAWRHWPSSRVPKHLVVSEEHCEFPIVRAIDRFDGRKVGRRFALSARHNVTEGDGSTVQAENVASAVSGQPPPRNLDRPSIWCVAAPGVELDTTGAYELDPQPKVGLIRVQDPARLPAPGARVDPGAYMSSTLWALVERVSRYETLVDPTPDQLAGSAPVQVIEARERPNGVDLFVVLGSRTGSFGFHVAITVRETSSEDRFWYGIEQFAGSQTMRLRVVTTGSVNVALTSLTDDTSGEQAQWQSWPDFWRNYAATLYERAEAAWSPDPGVSGLLAWFGDLAELSGTPRELADDTALKFLSDLNRSIGSVFSQQQAETLAAPFLSVEMLTGDEPAFRLPPPSQAPIHVRETDEAHPLAGLGGDLTPRFVKTPSYSSLILSGVTGLSQQTAEMITSIGLGFVPLVGDALDIVDMGAVVAHGQTSAGTEAGWIDWAGVGLFGLVSGAGVYLGLRTALRASYRTADWAALVRRLEDLEQTELRELRQLSDQVLGGAPLDELQRRKLRFLMAGLREQAYAADVLPVVVFDDLIGDLGFKTAVLEEPYKRWLTAAGKTDTTAGYSRKDWLRQLDETDAADADLRRLVTATLGETIAEIEFLNPARFPNTAAALDRYVELLRPPRPATGTVRTGFEGLSQAELERVFALRGPHGMGLDFDYERFPISELPVTIADRFQAGMPVNWPVKRTISVVPASGQRTSRVLGLEVPGYRTSAKLESTSSGKYADLDKKLAWSPDDRFRWRAWGNILYHEKAKRLLDPTRASGARRVTPNPKMVALLNKDPAEVLPKDLKDAFWPSDGTQDIFAPIADIPNEVLDYQLLRHTLSPTTPRARPGPQGGRSANQVIELDHEKIPQRVFASVGLRGLVRDEVIVDITRRSVPEAELPAYLAKLETPEYVRAIRLKNELQYRLGQTSGRNLVPKHRILHATDDTYAATRDVSFVMTRLRDCTFIREMSGIDASTLRLLYAEVESAGGAKGALDSVLRWTLNQEIRSRNLLMRELDGTELPKDVKAGLEDWLADTEAGLDPWIRNTGRRLPVEEDQKRFIRTRAWESWMDLLSDPAFRD